MMDVDQATRALMGLAIWCALLGMIVPQGFFRRMVGIVGFAAASGAIVTNLALVFRLV